jgi:hypothetical protein
MPHASKTPEVLVGPLSEERNVRKSAAELEIA